MKPDLGRIFSATFSASASKFIFVESSELTWSRKISLFWSASKSNFLQWALPLSAKNLWTMKKNIQSKYILHKTPVLLEHWFFKIMVCIFFKFFTPLVNVTLQVNSFFVVFFWFPTIFLQLCKCFIFVVEICLYFVEIISTN